MTKEQEKKLSKLIQPLVEEIVKNQRLNETKKVKNPESTKAAKMLSDICEKFDAGINLVERQARKDGFDVELGDPWSEEVIDKFQIFVEEITDLLYERI